MAQAVKNPPAVQETWVRSLGLEDPLEKGTATPLKYSGLENSMDRGAWQATVHGFTKSRTRLSDFHFTEGKGSPTLVQRFTSVIAALWEPTQA